jgi:hypothetical protein
MEIKLDGHPKNTGDDHVCYQDVAKFIFTIFIRCFPVMCVMLLLAS